ncbi:MAG: O-antigen ligase family protein [Flavobacterium sp.]|uniref:O-antigen ligase family protein n=1 Tax=Flavobacterium sp. TaxID=239 RepID=UPI0022BF2814|nr:O-antigen ligase family protein [Flavobacterium sp.]MCZ8197457.1 O-antigen ligase family protein [Flavobacterium sp.]
MYYKNISLKKIYEISVLLLLISLSFSKAFPNLILGLTLILFLFDRIKNKHLFRLDGVQISILTIMLYLLVKSSINNSLMYDSSILSRIIIILILPILICNISKNKIIFALIVSALVSITIATYNIFFFYLKYHYLPFERGEIINKLLVIERPYLGFFCLIALISCIYLSAIKVKYKTLLIILSLVFTFFIILIAARLALISGLLLSVIYLIFYTKYRPFNKLLILSISLVLVSIVVISNKNLSTRLLSNLTAEKLKYYDARIDIWDCSLRLIESKEFDFFFGSRSYQYIENSLVECYKTKFDYDLKKRSWFVESRFNTHNQFLDFFLMAGVLGAILFFYFNYLIIKESIYNFYFFSLVLSLVLFFIFENVFHRQLGCYLIAIIISIIKKDNTKLNFLNYKENKELI